MKDPMTDEQKPTYCVRKTQDDLGAQVVVSVGLPLARGFATQADAANWALNNLDIVGHSFGIHREQK